MTFCGFTVNRYISSYPEYFHAYMYFISNEAHGVRREPGDETISIPWSCKRGPTPYFWLMSFIGSM